MMVPKPRLLFYGIGNWLGPCAFQATICHWTTSPSSSLPPRIQYLHWLLWVTTALEPLLKWMMKIPLLFIPKSVAKLSQVFVSSLPPGRPPASPGFIFRLAVRDPSPEAVNNPKYSDYQVQCSKVAPPRGLQTSNLPDDSLRGSTDPSFCHIVIWIPRLSPRVLWGSSLLISLLFNNKEA